MYADPRPNPGLEPHLLQISPERLRPPDHGSAGYPHEPHFAARDAENRPAVAAPAHAHTPADRAKARQRPSQGAPLDPGVERANPVPLRRAGHEHGPPLAAEGHERPATPAYAVAPGA